MILLPYSELRLGRILHTLHCELMELCCGINETHSVRLACMHAFLGLGLSITPSDPRAASSRQYGISLSRENLPYKIPLSVRFSVALHIDHGRYFNSGTIVPPGRIDVDWPDASRKSLVFWRNAMLNRPVEERNETFQKEFNDTTWKMQFCPRSVQSVMGDLAAPVNEYRVNW